MSRFNRYNYTGVEQLTQKASRVFCTPEEFGAVGDGVVDDTTSLQNALNSGYLTVICFKNYKLTTTINIPANVNFITFSGSTLTFSGAPNSTNACVTLQNSAKIDGFNINVVAGNYQRTVNVRDSYAKVLRNKINVTTPNIPNGTAHYTIFCSMLPTLMYNIEIAYNDITMSNVYFGDGMQISGCPFIEIHHNYIHDTSMQHPQQLSWGIYVSQNCDNAKIYLNKLQNLVTSGIHLNSTSGTNNKYINVADNRLDNIQYVGISLDFVTNGVLSRNLISNTSEHIITNSSNYIIISENIAEIGNSTVIDSSRPVISVDINSSYITIKNNMIGDSGSCLIGISVLGVNCFVDGNTFKISNLTNFVYLGTGTTLCTVSNNMVYGILTATSDYIFYIAGNQNRVFNNRCVLNSNTTNTSYRITGTNHNVYRNFASGGKDGMYCSATGSNVENNHFVSNSRFAYTGEVNATKVINNNGYNITALPTASSTYEGAIIPLIGGSGVADSMKVCVADATGTFSWKTITIA